MSATATKTSPPTKSVRSDHRVVVNVYLSSEHREQTEERMEREGKRIEREINRHVDDVRAIYTFTTTKLCAFCEYPWDDHIDANGYPFCCNKAQAWADANGIKPVDDEPVTTPTPTPTSIPHAELIRQLDAANTEGGVVRLATRELHMAAIKNEDVRAAFDRARERANRASEATKKADEVTK